MSVTANGKTFPDPDLSKAGSVKYSQFNVQTVTLSGKKTANVQKSIPSLITSDRQIDAFLAGKFTASQVEISLNCVACVVKPRISQLAADFAKGPSAELDKAAGQVLKDILSTYSRVPVIFKSISFTDWTPSFTSSDRVVKDYFNIAYFDTLNSVYFGNAQFKKKAIDFQLKGNAGIAGVADFSLANVTICTFDADTGNLLIKTSRNINTPSNLVFDSVVMTASANFEAVGSAEGDITFDGIYADPEGFMKTVFLLGYIVVSLGLVGAMVRFIYNQYRK